MNSDTLMCYRKVSDDDTTGNPFWDDLDDCNSNMENVELLYLSNLNAGKVLKEVFGMIRAMNKGREFIKFAIDINGGEITFKFRSQDILEVFYDCNWTLQD